MSPCLNSPKSKRCAAESRAAVGCKIIAAERMPCPRKPIAIEPSFAVLARRVAGTRIERTDRAGKRVVLWLDSGDALVFEPRMTGLVLLAAPPDPLYSRLRLVLSAPGSARGSKRAGRRLGYATPRQSRGLKGKTVGQTSRRNGIEAPAELLYWDRRGLGSVKLLTQRQFDARYGLASLGPDALVMTAAMYHERLGKSTRAVKVALLDQKAVAGIGNLYASEILYLAGVHPARACRRVTQPQWQRIAAAALKVLETAIRYEGSTLSDGTYCNALNKEGGYQNEHRVYDKAGKPCALPSCGSAIVRVVQGQRSTFFCPKCQKR